jgi:hypothetical protein
MACWDMAATLPPTAGGAITQEALLPGAAAGVAAGLVLSVSVPDTGLCSGSER